MSVTIHIPAGTDAGELIRTLIDLAGGDTTAVRTASTGIVVPDRVAYTYLSALLGHTPGWDPPAPTPVPPTGPDDGAPPAPAPDTPAPEPVPVPETTPPAPVPAADPSPAAPDPVAPGPVPDPPTPATGRRGRTTTTNGRRSRHGRDV